MRKKNQDKQTFHRTTGHREGQEKGCRNRGGVQAPLEEEHLALALSPWESLVVGSVMAKLQQKKKNVLFGILGKSKRGPIKIIL